MKMFYIFRTYIFRSKLYYILIENVCKYYSIILRKIQSVKHFLMYNYVAYLPTSYVAQYRYVKVLEIKKISNLRLIFNECKITPLYLIQIAIKYCKKKINFNILMSYKIGQELLYEPECLLSLIYQYK